MNQKIEKEVNYVFIVFIVNVVVFSFTMKIFNSELFLIC